MISDNEPLVNAYVSTPKEMSQLNTAAFVAGIVEGVCDGAGFRTVSVSAHWTGDAADGGQEKGGKGEMWPGKTVFLIRFAPEVMEREELLGKTSWPSDSVIHWTWEPTLASMSPSIPQTRS